MYRSAAWQQPHTTAAGCDPGQSGVAADGPGPRAAHFSACRINWRDKADNLREIADELNLGLDSSNACQTSPSLLRLLSARSTPSSCIRRAACWMAR